MNKLIYGPIQNYRLDVARPQKIAKDMVNYLENYSDKMNLDFTSFTKSDVLQKNKQAVRLVFTAIAQLPQKYLAENADTAILKKMTALVESLRANKKFMKGLHGIIDDYYSQKCLRCEKTLFCHDLLHLLMDKVLRLKDLK